ncbi:MAG: glycosyltransferase [Anaerosomatales bacterium]|nr:glycosyltransferase [Anaerosomatales bacterium]
MRIMLVSHAYPPTISGVTVLVHKLAHAMRARGHETLVVAASDTGAPYEHDDGDVRVVRVRSAPNPYWPEGRLPIAGSEHLAEVVAGFAPHVVHSHESAWLAWQLSRLREEIPVPLLATCHFVPRFLSHYVGRPLRSESRERMAWRVAVRLLDRFDRVIFPTETQRAMYTSAGLLAPTAVISNGVDLQRYRPDSPDDIPPGLDLPPAPRVLAVGRVARDKRLDILLHALAYLRDTKASLVIAGDGADRSRLERLAHELALEDRVRFLGKVAEAAMPALYRACQTYAIASLVEVQSITTLQALACGVPVVAAAAGALPEILRNGECGLLVPPENPASTAAAIRSVLSDAALAQRLRTAGLDAVRSHDERLTFHSYEQVYFDLAAAA